MTQALRTRGLYWLLIAPALGLMVAFFIFPLLRILWISVAEPQIGLQNYELLVTSGAIQRILMTTARICILTTLLTLIGGYVVAYTLVHVGERQRQWMLFCVLLPFWL